MKPRMLILLVALSLPIAAQDPVRFLVPIGNAPIAGAHGSLWAAPVLVFNGSDRELEILPTQAPCPILCPDDSNPPGSTRGYRLRPPNEDGEVRSLLLSVPADQADGVAIAQRVRGPFDVGDDIGAEIPVVREDRLATTTVRLPFVPAPVRITSDYPWRVTLRIYALPETIAPMVEVRLLDSEGAVLRTRRIALQTYAEPIHAAQAQWSGIEQIYAEERVRGSISIEVQPLSEGMRFLAFATLTHNVTQVVRTIR